MEFKLDENIPNVVKAELESAGHDAMTCSEESIAGSVDPVVAQHAQNEDRVLVTLDLDFADIRIYPPGSHPGIIVLRLVRQDAASCVSSLQNALQQLHAADIETNLVIIEETRVRIRRAADDDSNE